MKEVDIVVEELLSDDWKIEHIAQHDVAPDEVEKSLADEYAICLKAKHGRIMVLGRAGNRLITTVLNEQEGEGVFYVITPRDMAKKERVFYRTGKGKRNDEEQGT